MFNKTDSVNFRHAGVKLQSFTLIELLVVIAIIAILAAILLPALNSARMRGQSAACINNLKQSMFAIQSYADTYNDIVPAKPGTQYNPNNSSLFWVLSTNGFVAAADPSSFCSVDSALATGSWGWATNVSRTYGAFSVATSHCGDYSTLKETLGDAKISDPSNNLKCGIKIGALKQVSNTVCIGDAGALSSAGANIPSDTMTDGSESSYIYPPYARHAKGSANAAFFDGHAEVMNKGKFAQVANKFQYFRDLGNADNEAL